MSKKKKYPENIQNLKNQLESGNNLIDYFFVCGVNPSICLDEDLYDFLNDNYWDNLSKKLKPKIISKFPEFDNNNDTIDDEIINFCFPNGFHLQKSFGEGLTREIFSIILDNNLFSSEFPQKYLTCLLFYEKIFQYKKLQKNINKVQKEKEEEELNKKMNVNPFGPKVSSAEDENNSKRKPYYTRQYKFKIKKEKNDNDIKEKKRNEHRYSFVSETVNLSRVSTLTQNASSLIAKSKYYYIPKCICIVSVHPFIKSFQKILSYIYQYSLSASDHQIPLEKIIANLIIEVPRPPRGLYSIEYYFLNYKKENEKLKLEDSENNKLLITEIDLKKFHKIIKFDIKVNALKHILLGSKILLFSENLNHLTETILAFLYLIFPFKYPFQVSSFLHKENYRILESISPFILGIKDKYCSDFFNKNDISVEGMNIFVIDLDNNKSELISEEKFPDFPNKSLLNFEKDLKEEIKINNNNESFKEFNETYQNIFFNFLCDIIKHYDEFLNLDYYKQSENCATFSIENLINCEKFINSHSVSDIPFYDKFVKESQLFADFIYKRMFPKNNQEIIEISLVNETLVKIKNKSKFFGKEQTDFIDSKEYKIVSKYIVPKPRELSEKEKKIIKSKLLKYSRKGQIIKFIDNQISEKPEENEISNKDKIIGETRKKEIETKEGNESDEKNKKEEIKDNECIESNKKFGEDDIQFVFTYNIFPELDFNLYINNNSVNEYILPPDYSEEIEAINTDLLSKSSLKQNINRSLEMKNCLYLSWLEIWAYTFWYIDVDERHYRFDQMLEVLDKVLHPDMNIFNLMFDILNKEKEDEMIQKLYKKLLQLKLNPSIFIYDIMSNILDKKQLQKMPFEEKGKSNIAIKFKDYKGKSYRKRTFFSESEFLLYIYKLKFNKNYFCINCNKRIDLLSLCKNFNNIRNDILWVYCSCGEYILPKLIVKFGHDLARPNKCKTFTIEENVLHSPYNLKINIKKAIKTNYDNKLDVFNFKSQFGPLFWNFIWYSMIHKLDYTILLPYLMDLEKLQKINYDDPNSRIFEIAISDKVYKENQEKIKDALNFQLFIYLPEKAKKEFKNICIDKGNTFEINNKKKCNDIENIEKEKTSSYKENNANKDDNKVNINTFEIINKIDLGITQINNSTEFRKSRSMRAKRNSSTFNSTSIGKLISSLFSSKNMNKIIEKNDEDEKED